MNCRMVHLRARGVRAAMFALHRGLDPRPTSLYRLTARCHWPYEPTGGEGRAWSPSWDFTLMPLQANLTLQPAPAKHQACHKLMPSPIYMRVNPNSELQEVAWARI